MKWDDFLGNDDEGGGSQQILPESAPDRPHVGEIVKAKLADKDFEWARSENNKNGTCLVVEVSVPKFKTFEATIPCHYTGKIQALCRSARVHPPAKGDDWDEGRLVGQTVTFDSVTVVSPRGTEYVKVTKWHANPAPPPADVMKRQAPARSQAAKAHREFTANAQAADDIPF